MRIGLLADGEVPTRLSRALADELPELLSERVDSAAAWDVSTAAEAIRGEDGTELIAVARQRMRDEDWAVAICLTEQALTTRGRPVVVDASAADGVGVVSLSALGPTAAHDRTREAVVALVGHLVGSARTGSRTDEGALGPDRSPAAGNAARDVHAVAARLRATTKLLAGMVGANRPWRLFPGMRRALTAMVASAVLAMASETVWQIGDELGGGRLLLLMIVSVAATVAWLIVAHRLWVGWSDPAAREQVRRVNAATVLTLAAGALVAYAVVFVAALVAAEVFIEGDLLRSRLQHSVGLGDYLGLAWIVASAATIGGALGSGLESGRAVREAAFARSGPVQAPIAAAAAAEERGHDDRA